MMMNLMMAVLGASVMIVIIANQFAPADEKLTTGDIWGLGTVMLVGALTARLVFDLRLEVHPDHAVISWGPFGYPRRRIHWSHVLTVRAIDIRPTEWGGWGYRWVPWRKATAAVLRKGPGLRFDFKGGKVFVMSLPDPGAALVAIESVMPKEPDYSCGHDHS